MLNGEYAGNLGFPQAHALCASSLHIASKLGRGIFAVTGGET